MSQHEIKEEKEPAEARKIAGPEADAGDQSSVVSDQKIEEPDPGKYLNEHLFPRPGWPGWELGPTLLERTNPEEFEKVNAFAKKTWGMELS